jgi:hypothetical protein
LLFFTVKISEKSQPKHRFCHKRDFGRRERRSDAPEEEAGDQTATRSQTSKILIHFIASLFDKTIDRSPAVTGQ